MHTGQKFLPEFFQNCQQEDCTECRIYHADKSIPGQCPGEQIIRIIYGQNRADTKIGVIMSVVKGPVPVRLLPVGSVRAVDPLAVVINVMQGIQSGIRFQIQKQLPLLKGIKLLDVGTVGGHRFFQRIGDGVCTAKGSQGSVDPAYHCQAQGNTCSQYKPVLPAGRIIEKSAQCPGTAGP